MKIKVAKKVLTICAIALMGITVSLLIAGIFGLPIFNGEKPWLYLFLTTATLAVASAFSITALSLINKKRTISIVSLCLLIIDVICAIIVYWSHFKINWIFGNLVAVFSIALVLFVIIIKINYKNGTRYKVLQTVCYSFIVLLDVWLTLVIWGINVFSLFVLMPEIFAVICLVVLALLCTLSILGKKGLSEEEAKKSELKDGIEEVITDDDFVTIPKEEYESMKLQLRLLKAQLKELKKDAINPEE